MYDLSKLVHGNHVSVAEVIEQLQKLPQNAVFTCCGEEYLFIHVEEDGSVVTIDTESLADAYPEDELDMFPSDNEIPKFGGSLHRDMIQVLYSNEEVDEDDDNQLLYNDGLYWVTKEDYENLDNVSTCAVYGTVISLDPICMVDKKNLSFTGRSYSYGI